MTGLARNVRPYFGDWHKHRYAFDVFKIGIDTLLTKIRPKGEPVPPPLMANFAPAIRPKRPVRRLPRQRSSRGVCDEPT
jgi:hypothetical protein